jgi:plastocyanin
VTEADGTAAGWELTKLECSDDNSTGNIGERKATFNVEAGETVTCTFTNTKQGAIIVEKLATSYGSTASFGFTGKFEGTLADKGKSDPVSVSPGDYSVTESAAPGWDLYSIECNDSNSSGNTSARTATFKVEAGETVTCTFTNKPLTNITVSASSQVPGGTNSTITCEPSYGPEVGGNPTLSLTNLQTGTYKCQIVIDGTPPAPPPP